MEWVSAKELIAALEVGHGPAYCDPILGSARSAVYQRVRSGLLPCLTVKILRDGEPYAGTVPLAAWGRVRRADWFTGDFHLIEDGIVDRDAIRRGRLSSVSYLLFGAQFGKAEAIEMGAVFAPEGVPAPLPKRGRGRTPTYDWNAALTALHDYDALNDVIAPVVQNRADQSTLENWLTAWFAKRDEYPSVSIVREHVGTVVQSRRESMAS